MKYPAKKKSVALAGRVARLVRRLALPALIVMAVALRFIGIGDESLWLDEGDTVRVAQLPLAELVANRFAVGHPPLYFSLLALWVRLCGTSEAAARSLSALASAAAVLATWQLGRRMLGRRGALLAALFMTLLPLQIYYAQEVRGYALLTLVAVWAMQAFLALLRRPQSRLALAGFAAAAVALYYIHVLGVLLLLAPAAELLWRFRRQPEYRRAAWRRWLLAGIAIAGAALPLLAGYVAAAGEFSAIRSSWMLRPPDLAALGAFLATQAGSLPLLGLALVPAVAAGWRMPGGRRGAMERLLLLWLLLPLLAGFIMSNLTVALFQPRYFIGISPAWCLLLAAWLNRGFRVAARNVLIAAMILLTLPVLHHHYTTNEKEDWRYLAWFIDINARPDDLLLFNAGYCRDAVYRYYARRADLPTQVFPVRQPDGGELIPLAEQAAFSVRATEFRRITDTNAADVPAVIAGHPRVWLICAHQDDARQLLRRELARHLFLQYEEHLAGIDYYLYGREARRVTVEPR